MPGGRHAGRLLVVILAYAVATCANASDYYRTVAGNAQPSPMLRTRDYNMESPEWAPAMVPPAYPTGIPMCVCVCVCVCVFVDAK